MNKTVAIIGAGRVGGALGRLLAKAGWTITALACRSMIAAQKAKDFIGSGAPMTDVAAAARTADVVFITTPDSAIKDVCDAIANEKGFRVNSIIVHTSGAHTLDLLDTAKRAGAFRAVIHPLQSVPSMEQGAVNIPGSSFRIDADPEALDIARALVDALGGTELKLPLSRQDRHSAALYHAGAVVVSNYFVALIDYGLKFYQALGAEKQDALQAVLPLIRGTLDNIEKLGTTAALTGPIARGDKETIKGHLAAIRRRAPELYDLYCALAKQTAAIAKERGLDEKTVEELLMLLQEDIRSAE